MDKATEYINIIYQALSEEEVNNLKNKLIKFNTRLWESNALSAEKSINLCKEIIDIIDYNIYSDEDLSEWLNLLLEEGPYEEE